MLLYFIYIFIFRLACRLISENIDKSLCQQRMATGITKMKVLSIYKNLLRESQKFNNYNFREYALRRVRDGFRANKTLSDPKQIQKEYQFATENIMVIRRQAAIGDMYQTEKLVIQNIR